MIPAARGRGGGGRRSDIKGFIRLITLPIACPDYPQRTGSRFNDTQTEPSQPWVALPFLLGKSRRRTKEEKERVGK